MAKRGPPKPVVESSSLSPIAANFLQMLCGFTFFWLKKGTVQIRNHP